MQTSTKEKGMKNDYSQYFVDTGQRPQNFIRDIEPSERFREYPKLDELIKHKNDLIKKRNHPPIYLKEDIRTLNLNELGKYEVILMDPPWKEYQKRAEGLPIFKDDERMEGWDLDDISNIKIDQLAGTPSFLFIWVGSEHLDDGRNLLKLWGYKRCEDIVWLKTNKSNPGHSINPRHYMQHIKEHCLVGVRGDVRRASDSYFIHANIDTDVIVSEEFEPGSTKKPEEIYDIIERFCLGRRRIELFANNQSIRPGWISIGKHINSSNFDLNVYNSWLEGEINLDSYIGGSYIGTTEDIESLRPKSPKQSNSNGNGSQIPSIYSLID